MFKDLYSGISKNKHRRMKYLVSCLLVCFFVISAVYLVLTPETIIPKTQADESTDTNNPSKFPYVGDPNDLKLSELQFWIEGHRRMIKEESGGK